MDKMAKVERASAAGESLEQLKQRFICWRESRKQGARIPQALWAAAVGEAKQYGVYQVARALARVCHSAQRVLIESTT